MEKFAAAYIRVSDPSQVNGFSLESQDELTLAKASYDGYVVSKEAIFSDEGISGKTMDRPGLQELINYAVNPANKITAIYIYAINRLNRNTIDYLTLRKKLAAKGISIVSVTEPTGTSDDSEFIETLFAGWAQWDNQKRSTNIKAGNRRRFLDGYITSRPPIGYKMYRKDETTRAHAIKDPKTYDAIKHVWRRVLNEKLSTRQVANILNEMGVRSTHSRKFTKFYSQSVSKIFSNKFYMGVLVSKIHGEVRGLHEPMVTEAEFYEVRQILTGKRPSKHERYMKLNPDFPLKGLLRCLYCDRKLTAGFSTGRTTKVGYYSCYTRDEHQRVAFNRVKVMTNFEELLEKIQVKKEKMQWFRELLEEKYESKYKVLEDTSKLVKKDIEALKTVKKSLAEKHLRGLYTDEEFLEIKEDLNMQIIVKEGLISEKKISKLEIKTILNFMEYYLTHLNIVYKKATPEGKLRVQSSIFPLGLVHGKQKFRTPTLGLGYRLNSTLATTMPHSVIRRSLSSNYFEVIIEEYKSIYKQLSPFILPVSVSA